MSTAYHHSEWLSLLEISGPFLSMPVLLRALPQGLEATDPALRRNLRLAYEEWEATGGEATYHRAWAEWVLREALGMVDEVLHPFSSLARPVQEQLALTVAEHGEVVRPDWVIAAEPGERPRLLVLVVPPQQGLERPLRGSHWSASPATRLMLLLHATGVRLGLVTNGEQWMLVDAPRGESAAFVSWYAALWLEEPLTLQAFTTLLSVRRFFGVAEEETIEALLAASASDQQDVTDQLGAQVRSAVELLVQAWDRADEDHGRALLAGVAEETLYEAALSVMMRLVFLLAAEERDLLRLGDPLYDEHYAISTLAAQLRERADRAGEMVLERKYDAWYRLLSTFRAVHGGIWHDRLTLPAYGGSLFDPDRFPFLEGRASGSTWHSSPALPIPVNNRTVLHLLEALQYLQVKGPGGASENRRLSFRALDIEQIGHVYEGLLDHRATRATQAVLGLQGTKGKEPEIPLAELESERSKGEASFAAYLREVTGRSASALRKALGAMPDMETVQRLRSACGNDEALYQRVLPFWGLLRNDSYELPVVIPAGGLYVTAGSERRATGTHYTPRSLTEPIVQHTLEPLVYEGPAEGKLRETWRLHTPARLLELKVCDMAMGSGAFLVQACRYLSERLVEAWEEAGPGLRTPEGRPTSDPDEALPPDATDRLALARRLVVERCLYGVDKNPLAVEMAKLSLWLITLNREQPFTFVDHALQCGDSLVGISRTDQLLTWSLEGVGKRAFETLSIASTIEEVIRLRREIAATPVRGPEDEAHKKQLLREADMRTSDLCAGADMLIGSYYNDLSTTEQGYLRATLLSAFRDGSDVPAERAAQAHLGDLRPFHWPLEFPEVFLAEGRSGFDAFIGNPPFLGGKRIATVLGTRYQSLLKSQFSDSTGAADLCAYFLRQAFALVQFKSGLGLIATNTIAQGATKDVGLNYLVNKEKARIIRALSSTPWPGAAGVHISIIWIYTGLWYGEIILNQIAASRISASLTDEEELGTAKKLRANEGFISEGIKIHGNGFVLEPEERDEILAMNEKYKEVIHPYLSGTDVTNQPTLAAPRYVINFRNWDEDRAREYRHPFEIVTERVKPYRDGLKGQLHESRYWIFWDRREAFFESIGHSKRILVCSGVAKYLAIAFVPTNQVLSQKVKIFAFDDWRAFAVLQSNLHEQWAWGTSSTLETRLSYSNTNAFLTFPFPRPTPEQRDILENIGEEYHEFRRQIMLARQEGLTATYNRFHKPDETAEDIARLRALHVEMDQAVAAAYGWVDLDLGHDFHDTAQGVRYTISEAARREVLGRLLELNHARYAEEQAAAAQGKGEGKAKGKRGKAKESGGDEGQLGWF